jgi:hypothetical protein
MLVMSWEWGREDKEVADRIEGVVYGFLAAWRTLDGLKRAAKLRDERWHNIVRKLPQNVVLLKVNSRLS